MTPGCVSCRWSYWQIWYRQFYSWHQLMRFTLPLISADSHVLDYWNHFRSFWAVLPTDVKSCNCSGTSCRLQIMNKNRAAICFVLFKSSDPDIALCIMYFQKITVSLVIFCHGEDIVAWLPPFRLCSFAITAYFVKHLKKDIAEFRSFYMEVRTWKNRQNVLFLCVYRIVHYCHVTPSLHNQYRFT